MDENIVEIVVTIKPIMQFSCPSRIRIFRTIFTNSCLKRYTKKPDNYAVNNTCNFYDRHTYIWTWQHSDQPGPEGRVGENQIIISNRLDTERPNYLITTILARQPLALPGSAKRELNIWTFPHCLTATVPPQGPAGGAGLPLL